MRSLTKNASEPSSSTESESRNGAASGGRDRVPRPARHSLGISRKSISEHELNRGPVLPSLPGISFSGWARWMSAWHVGVAFVHQGTTMIANHDLPPELHIAATAKWPTPLVSHEPAHRCAERWA